MIAPHPLLPTGARTVIAGLLERVRDDVCTVQRPASGVDATGAPNSGVTTVAVEPCAVRAPGRVPVERAAGGGFGPVADYEVRFAPHVDVRSEDQIVVNGRTLEVIADLDAISHGFELVVQTRAVVS